MSTWQSQLLVAFGGVQKHQSSAGKPREVAIGARGSYKENKEYSNTINTSNKCKDKY